jgi:hypothetical protein
VQILETRKKDLQVISATESQKDLIIAKILLDAARIQQGRKTCPLFIVPAAT